jgi:pimeloyl-[acyl-carrier protein] methyl ester esterase
MMQLVFIHGWAFDTHVWNALSPLLSKFPQKRIDLGYFGEATKKAADKEPSILVGHSLGFVHGINMRQDWAGWIAINSFSNFVISADGIGCVTPSTPRAMRKQMTGESEHTLDTFYKLIDTPHPKLGTPNIKRLQHGLDELYDADIRQALPGKPGLVLAAEADPLVPMKTSKALAVAGTQLHWHQIGTHMLPLTGPQWCATHITNFINKNFP